MSFGFQTFNDRLAAGLLLVVIPILWALHAAGVITLPGEVLGGLIAAFTLIIQFYFRKSGPPTNGSST